MMRFWNRSAPGRRQVRRCLRMSYLSGPTVLSPSDMCAKYYLEGYPEEMVVGAIRDSFPACTMPLACTSPVRASPSITRNPEYALDYVRHAALVRELLDMASLPTNAQSLSMHRLLQSLGGLLSHSANLIASQEPISLWSITGQISQRDGAIAVYQKTTSDGYRCHARRCH